MVCRLRNALSWASTERLSLAQAWANRRFDGLSPSDFHAVFRILATADLESPQGFEEVWSTVPEVGPGDSPPLSPAQLDGVDTVLILCDPSQPEQVQLLQECERCLAEAADAPMMMWVPHTVAPEVRPEAEARVISPSFLCSLLSEDCCLEGIVDGEPEGFGLAIALQALALQTAYVASRADKMAEKRRRDVARAQEYSDSMDEIIWDYARVRLAPLLPKMDCSVAQGELPESLSGYAMGRKLGSGSCGTVFSLDPTQSPARHDRPQQVLKIMDKAAIVELDELRCLNRQIDVQQTLSSDAMAHPNIVRLHEVYHVSSQIIFRMEFAGQQNLYQRLAERERQGELCQPMSPKLTRRLVQHAATAVAHMHEVAKICHRDIKPENFVLGETGGESVLKLADFDLAVDVRKSATCRGRCGTVPFIAPEVLSSEPYSALAADVWSLAAVLLEVHCGVRVIERELGLRVTEPAAVAPTVKAFFEKPGVVETFLAEQCRGDVRFLLPTTSKMLAGMLTTKVEERWDAQGAARAAESLSAQPLQPMPPAQPRAPVDERVSKLRVRRMARLTGGYPIPPPMCEKRITSLCGESVNRHRRLRVQNFQSSPAGVQFQEVGVVA